MPSPQMLPPGLGWRKRERHRWQGWCGGFAAVTPLCYKRLMRDVRDWMRDLMRRRSRRGPNNSESTGKSGQELPQNQQAPLRPSYPEPVSRAEPEAKAPTPAAAPPTAKPAAPPRAPRPEAAAPVPAESAPDGRMV